MTGRHSGKIAIVTGSGSGYGRGIAEKLVAEGAQVIIVDISEEAGLKAATELNATFVHANITKRTDWENVLLTAVSKFGSVDIIVNNAGICYDAKPSETVEEALFDRLMDVNVKSIFQSTSVILPYLLKEKKKAVFISTASTSAMRPRPELSWYAASKAAVNTVSNAMAVEYASRGIRFNTVCPVVGLTNMQVQPCLIETSKRGLTWIRTSNFLSDEENQKRFASVIPTGRMCTPRDVANAVSYLASDDADFITGVNFPVSCLFTIFF
jgi:NAD(P)-dependent dehydrogenase (short-subunit alcohol dehydrogenase family)